MKISEVILERIKTEHALDAYVKGASARIDDHISSNSMVFFPEYTDHNVPHLEAVLETAVDLATQKSLELLTNIDLVILTTSVMLHDLGMHLTKDGFQTLVDPTGPMKPIDGFDDLPWHELWLSFLSEARRFDARKLEQLFGENYRPVTAFPSFDDPWDEFDIFLVGEFLRLHHPRLAHEIALKGMPAKNGSVVEFCGVSAKQDNFISDISGLVARSHGMGLRDTFSYLENNYSNKIETRSAHPIYLMTLLRVSDYLQIQSARAPSSRTDVCKLKSPVSTREWSVHQCVTDINNIADPEAIDITAQPENVNTFLRLKDWILDLQRELDISWAVIGEVYGLQSHSGLNKLGLRIRRLRSNLDKVDAFSETVNFIPKQIAFTAAGSDLLKLLVGPLYANEVSVGLRELVQNATDAVKELDNLVEQGFVELPERRTDISTDVQVDFIINNTKSTPRKKFVEEITITDRGVGMTSEILQNYFLKAGASFRSSNTWKEQFERPDGTSKVQRSGRFGVGALAAFLLGDEINVETRHYLAPSHDGLKFSASIETSSISVLKAVCNIGTKIRINIPDRLQETVGDLLPYSYTDTPKVNPDEGISEYFGRHPELSYTINGENVSWDEKCLLPNSQSRFEDPWNYFETDSFEVNWTYARNTVGLAVNQIRISGNGDSSSGIRADEAGVRLKSKIFSEPSLSVGDNTGSFALNLQRSTYAASELPFAEELLKEITDEWVFCCLWELSKLNKFPDYSGTRSLYRYRTNEPRWLECSDGVILNEPQFVKKYDPAFAFTRHGGHEEPDCFDDLIGGLPKKSIFVHEANDEFTERSFNMKGKLTRVLQGSSLDVIRQTSTSQTTFVPDTFINLIRNKMRPGKDARELLDSLHSDSVPGWSVQTDGHVKEPKNVKSLRESLEKDGISASVINLYSLSGSLLDVTESIDSVVFERWIELLEQPFLPRATVDLAKLQDALANKLGQKYDVFERRAKISDLKEKEKKSRIRKTQDNN